MTYLQALLCKGIVREMVASKGCEDPDARGYAEVAKVIEGLPEHYDNCGDEASEAIDKLEESGYLEWRYSGCCADYAYLTDAGYVEWLRETGRDPEKFDPRTL